MNELHLQDKFLIPFFTATNGSGLGYREVKANTIDTSSLICESDLIEFLSCSEVNKSNYAKLLKKFKNKKNDLVKELVEFLSTKIQDSNMRNMALFLNHNNSSFTFEGLKFYLFNRSDSQTKRDMDFKENIFSVVPELTYKYSYKGKRIFWFRPDISLFVNGIYLGYCELKSNYTNQSAKKDGKKKIRKDYKDAVISYLDIVKENNLYDKDGKFNKEAKDIRNDFLKIFEKAIWLSTTDIKETFVIRDITKYFDEIKNQYDSKKYDYTTYEQNITKALKPYPLTQKYEKKQDILREIFQVHYSKEMIEKEILYYNFIERDTEIIDGKKTSKNQKGNLISPRPKQKFGVDKIIKKIEDLMEHETESDYFIKKLEEELKDYPESIRNELIEKRMSYQNNKNIYSLLLQYAAGFGKSNIIGWSALQLKDLKKDGAYLYDKVMLIVDRVQLRDQLSTKMFNMNIDNKMYLEADDKKSFQNALKSDIRLVVVNLQKFGDMAKIIDAEILEKLKNLRVVFLIDEIHRSNSGSQNENMVSIFDEVQNSFDTDNDYKNSVHKKNLIIGFTATPSDHTLARFGEFNKYAEGEKIWVPFDSYTMKEAIEDGYILNPLKGIVSISAKMYFEIPENELEGFEKEGEEKQYSIKKKKIYENYDRIDAIAQHIVKNLVQVVYKQIRGYGKAMLATTSIKAAQIYKERIEYYFKEITQDDKYLRYKDSPILIVYSSSQEQSKATTLNEGLNEKKVLQEFSKPANNGIIIVVDKLQTGFDEPKLHTLFLDKEIRGINAIQTISRVNRTTKFKKDCKIVDFSHKNVNAYNIKEAYEHFSDVVVSDFDPLGELKLLDVFYNDLKSTNVYKEYYDYFLKLYNDETSDPEYFMDLENSFEKYITTHPIRSNELKQKINKYFRVLGLIEYIIDFDKKYLEDSFLKFFKKFNDIYNAINRPEETNEVDIYFDEQIGIVEVSKMKEVKPHIPPTSGGIGTGNAKKYKYKILEIIEKRNAEEANIGKLIEEFEQSIKTFFEYVSNHKDCNNLKAKMKGTQFGEDEIYNDFTKIYNSFFRRNKGEQWDFFKKNTKDLVEKLCDDFEEIVLHKDK